MATKGAVENKGFRVAKEMQVDIIFRENPLVERKSPANIPYSLILKQIGIC